MTILIICVLKIIFQTIGGVWLFFHGLITTKSVNTIADKFSDYLLETYIEKDAIFLPNIWAKYLNLQQLQILEKLNASFGEVHSSIFVLL